MIQCVTAVTIFFAVSDVSSCPIVFIKNFIQAAPSWLVARAMLLCLSIDSPFFCSPAAHHVSWIPHSLCLFHLLFSVRSCLTAPIPIIPPSTVHILIF